MAINLLSEEPLEDNAALFENDAITGHDQGDITWTEPTETSTGVWEVEFEGTDTQGGTIDPTTEDILQSTKPTPGQVFWWLAEKLKETLCPSCM